AIKSNEFFSALLQELHDSLQFKVDKKLRANSTEFIDEIRKQTEEANKDIYSKLKIESRIQMPPTFRELFALFDFETVQNKQSISLSYRGDGIKVRHIPILLKFIADRIIKNKLPREIPRYTIWGYEEPENNLELNYAFELAEEFLGYSSQPNLQMIVTTHSPAFYGLTAKEKVRSYFVTPNVDFGTSFSKIEQERIDDDMGLLPVIAPKIEVERQKRISAENMYSAMKQRNHGRAIFVEGETDRKYFVAAKEIFGAKIEYGIYSKTSAGASWVADQVLARCYGRTQEKLIGIFDSDEKGKEEKGRVEADAKFLTLRQKSLVKVLPVSKPQWIIEFLQRGIEIEWG
ncbi:MAG TPA: AAA family ATPase, partial [Bacteroidia bacterium]|nr:AAA family ATPase [Bacteroidia bacterium]